MIGDSPEGRKDDVVGAQKIKVDYLLDWCAKHNAYLFVAGDFTHQSRSWYLMDFWLTFLRQQKGDVRIFSIYGQHDTYMYSETTRGATVLGALINAGVVEHLTPVGTSFLEFDIPVRVFGVNYGQAIPDITTVGEVQDVKILLIHQMIVPHKIWAGQEGYIYAPELLNTYTEFDLILCGDCHRKFLFKSVDGKERYICNTGPMTRYEADEYNFKHKPGFYSYNIATRKLKWHTLPHEPAENVLSRKHIDKREGRLFMLGEFVGAVKSKQFDSGTSYKQNIRNLVKSEKVNQGVIDILSETIDEGVL
jgi:hypothetical protein